MHTYRNVVILVPMVKACILTLISRRTVIAGELEGSWRAGGQQEGLQYNGEAAGWKMISGIFL